MLPQKICLKLLLFKHNLKLTIIFLPLLRWQEALMTLREMEAMDKLEARNNKTTSHSLCVIVPTARVSFVFVSTFVSCRPLTLLHLDFSFYTKHRVPKGFTLPRTQLLFFILTPNMHNRLRSGYILVLMNPFSLLPPLQIHGVSYGFIWRHRPGASGGTEYLSAKTPRYLLKTA